MTTKEGSSWSLLCLADAAGHCSRTKNTVKVASIHLRKKEQKKGSVQPVPYLEPLHEEAGSLLLPVEQA